MPRSVEFRQQDLLPKLHRTGWRVAGLPLDTAARGVLADYESVSSVFLIAVAVPSMIGEGWLGLWLLLTKRIQG